MSYKQEADLSEYKLTRRGMLITLVITILGITALLKGSIYLAVFSFIFFSLVLAVTLYEVFINKTHTKP